MERWANSDALSEGPLITIHWEHHVKFHLQKMILLVRGWDLGGEDGSVVS